jgi:hypothetical protein
MRWGFTAFCAICAILAQGCYSGLQEAPDAGADETDTAGEGSSDGSEGGDDSGEPAAQCRPPLARIWKLTARQYDASLHRALPAADPALLRDAIPDHLWFSNSSEGSELSIERVTEMFRHTETEVERVVADPGLLAPCLADVGPSDEACLEEALTDFMVPAYRRPVTAVEVEELVDYVHERAAIDGPSEALGLAVHTVLSSPSFLFRTELGPADEASEELELDAYETASALGYFLTEGPPDELLWAAAEAGELRDPQVRAEHARRLLAEPSSSGLQRFFAEYTRTTEVADLERDPEEYPDFQSTLAADFETELSSFVAHVLTEDDARLETLLTASYSIVSPALADFYGVTMEAEGEGWAKVELPPDQRAGLLTMPAILAMGSRFDHGDPVSRGIFIRQRLLCDELPPPPPNIPPIPEWDGTTTQRDRLAAHAAEASCRLCHEFMDPLGLPFEHYDAVGRFRQLDHGMEIDPSGMVVGLGEKNDERVAVADAIELAHTLAVRPEVQGCFVQTVFEYAYGRAPADEDACELERLAQGFAQSDGDVIELVVDIVASEHFIVRRRTP